VGSTNSTRVKAPDSPAAGTPSVQFADLTAVGLSSIGDAHSLMKADTVAATSGPCSMDLRSTVKVATWNVLTLSRTGYQVALSREMARHGLDIVGLTEARIMDSGRYDVEDALLLHSGATTLVHGVALMLRNKAKRALRSWSVTMT